MTKQKNRKAKYRRNRTHILAADRADKLIEDIKARERRKLYQNHPDIAPDEMERRVESIMKRHDVYGSRDHWQNALLTGQGLRPKGESARKAKTHRTAKYKVAQAFKAGGGLYS